MKVKIIKTGRIEEYNDSYAARLMEQGKAVKAAEPPITDKPEKAKQGKQGKKCR